MSSRKNLKKSLSAYVGDLLSQCALLSLVVSDADREKVYSLIDRLVELEDDLTRRISHTEPGQAKAFYRQWKADFKATLAALQADFEQLIPA